MLVRFKFNCEAVAVDAEYNPPKQEIEGTIHKLLTEYLGVQVLEIECTELEVTDV